MEISDLLINEIFKTCALALSQPPRENKIMNKKIQLKDHEKEFKKYSKFLDNLCSNNMYDDNNLQIKREENVNSEKSVPSPRCKLWTLQDSEILAHYCKSYNHDWKKIAIRIRNLTKKTFRIAYLKNRFAEYKKGISQPVKSKFDRSEDDQLMNLVEKHGKDWKIIQIEMAHRSEVALKNRYYYKIRTELNHGGAREI